MGKKMDPRYLNGDDVRMRLHQSVVRYKGKPYYCFHDGGTQLTLGGLEDNSTEIVQVDANSEDLDIRSPELGYVNWKQGCGYVSRSAVRRQKQGISHENLFMRNAGSDQQQPLPANYLRTTEFFNMLIGNYPSYEEAMKNSRQFTAIHRSFMVGKFKDTIKLYFNEREIAHRARKEEFFLTEPEVNSVLIIRLTQLGVPIA